MLRLAGDSSDMATHEEALTAKKALNSEAFNGRVLTVKWCAVVLCLCTVRSCLLDISSRGL